MDPHEFIQDRDRARRKVAVRKPADHYAGILSPHQCLCEVLEGFDLTLGGESCHEVRLDYLPQEFPDAHLVYSD